jgi:hypothetical protein
VLKDGDRVNLGMGLRSRVAAHVPHDIDVFSIPNSCEAPLDLGVYCGLSQVPTFLPESLIVMLMPCAAA